MSEASLEAKQRPAPPGKVHVLDIPGLAPEVVRQLIELNFEFLHTEVAREIEQNPLVGNILARHVIRALSKPSPAFERWFEARRYAGVPAGYGSLGAGTQAAWYSCLMCNQSLPSTVEECADPTIEAIIGNAVTIGLARHGNPTWWVSADMLRAFLLTEPPTDMALGDLQSPFPVMRFILPEAVPLVSNIPGYGRVEQLVVAFLRPDNYSFPDEVADSFPEIFTPPFRTMPVSMGYFVIRAIVRKRATWSHHVLLRPLEEFTMQELRQGTWQTKADLSAAYVGQGHDFLYAITSLGVMMALALQHQPALVEAGSCVKAPGIKKGQPRPGLWTPSFLGRGYHLARPPQGGTHASPHFHWRKGHHRHQPYGPGRTQNKIIWIEPTCVMGNLEAEQLQGGMTPNKNAC